VSAISRNLQEVINDGLFYIDSEDTITLNFRTVEVPVVVEALPAEIEEEVEFVPLPFEEELSPEEPLQAIENSE
jgi:hypothetical protein